jgi:hypothetical protein
MSLIDFAPAHPEHPLSAKPSEVIVQAVEDWEWVIAHPRVEFVSEVWVKETSHRECEVCFAGASMLRRVERKYLQSADLHYDRLGGAQSHRFLAIACLSRGYVLRFLQRCKRAATEEKRTCSVAKMNPDAVLKKLGQLPERVLETSLSGTPGDAEVRVLINALMALAKKLSMMKL